jgi:hypothetical protein
MGLFRNEAARRAERSAAQAASNLENLLANRQEIINPYGNVQDLSSMISNPFANLQVATKAAEMQAQQTDISLAQTLDTLRATGAGAGGATALAQAAARSKQGIAASIEQQEAQNAQLRARGEQQAIQMRMSEAQRMQEADILGQTFQFQAQEQRDVADISRQASLQQQYEQQYQQAKQNQAQLLGSVFSTLGSIAAAPMKSGGSLIGNFLGGN